MDMKSVEGIFLYRIRMPPSAPIRCAAAIERGGGGPVMRAVDASGAGVSVCWEVLINKKKESDKKI